MRILLALLYALNTAPLLIYPFIFLPAMQLVKTGGAIASEPFFVRFCVLGFGWSVLFYPAILAYSHWNSISMQRRDEDGLAVRYQLVSSFALALIFGYFLVGEMYP